MRERLWRGVDVVFQGLGLHQPELCSSSHVDPCGSRQGFPGHRQRLGAFLAQPPARLSCHTSCQPPERGLDTVVCWKSLTNTMVCQRNTCGFVTCKWKPGTWESWESRDPSALWWWQPQACAELQERWDSAPRDAQAGIVGPSVQGQQSESVVRMGPFQLRTFHDSVNSGKLLLLQAQLQRKQKPECCVNVPWQ